MNIFHILFRFITLVIMLTASAIALSTGDFNFEETATFGEIESISSTTNSNTIDLFDNSKSVSFSGRLDSLSTYGVNRNWLAGHGAFADNVLYNYQQADLFLDIRLPKGIKAFADLSITNLSSAVSTASSSTVVLDVKELFIDFNLERKILIRTGKQFMQWGRAYFWNPVDFVNTNQRSFFNLNAVRSGIYGMRVQVPLDAGGNFYSFVNLSDASNLTDLSLLLRYEWLFGSTELGASVWGAYQEVAKLGLDASTRLLDMECVAELAIANGSNQDRVNETGGSYSVNKTRDTLVADAVVGLSRQFNWERPDRINVHGEIYYHGDGYNDNILADSTRSALLLANDLYTANKLSAWYSALFITINEFPYHSSSWTCNVMQNLVDSSGLFSTGLTYQMVDGFQLSPSLAIYYGSDQSEYLLYGYGMSLLMQGVLTF